MTLHQGHMASFDNRGRRITDIYSEVYKNSVDALMERGQKWPTNYDFHTVDSQHLLGIERPGDWYVGNSPIAKTIRDGKLLKFENYGGLVDAVSKAFPVVAGTEMYYSITMRCLNTNAAKLTFMMTTITDDALPDNYLALSAANVASPTPDHLKVLPRDDPQANGWVRTKEIDNQSLSTSFTTYVGKWTVPAGAKWCSLTVRKNDDVGAGTNEAYVSDAHLKTIENFQLMGGKLQTSLAIVDVDAIPANATHKMPIYDTAGVLVGYLPIVADF